MAKAENTILLFKEMVGTHKIELTKNGIPRKPIRKLIRFFQSIEDVRLQGKVSYPLHEIIMVMFLAILSGATTIVEISLYGEVNKRWLERHFGVKHGIPSHDTFRRVLSLIDPSHLQTATVSFLLENIKVIKRAFQIDTGIKQYCLDGKTARRTGRLKGTEREVKQLHTLHVYDRSDGICIVSKEAGKKTNEIPVAQEILKLLDLNGSIVSFDALNTQRGTIAVIVAQKGGYVAAIKGNQPELYQNALTTFTPSLIKRIETDSANYFEVCEKSHSRIEVRKYYLTKNVSKIAKLQDWPGLKAIAYYTLHTQDVNTGKTTFDEHYYISSVTDAELCFDIISGHWAVENQLHWHLDVNFLEDATEIIDRSAFQNFSLLNKMALSLLKLIAPLMPVTKSIRGARRSVGWNKDLLINTFRVIDEDTLSEAMQKVKTKR